MDKRFGSRLLLVLHGFAMSCSKFWVAPKVRESRPTIGRCWAILKIPFPWKGKAGTCVSMSVNEESDYILLKEHRVFFNGPGCALWQCHEIFPGIICARHLVGMAVVEPQWLEFLQFLGHRADREGRSDRSSRGGVLVVWCLCFQGSGV